MDPNLLHTAAHKLIAFHKQAQERNEWTFFVDAMYAPGCVYTCEYAGTMLVRADGIDEIKATHYGRDMLKGWDGWTCLLYTSPSPRDRTRSRMPSSA